MYEYLSTMDARWVTRLTCPFEYMSLVFPHLATLSNTIMGIRQKNINIIYTLQTVILEILFINDSCEHPF